MGVAEIEEALRVGVSEVCRSYFLQVWNEALNQARVEAFSALRRVESIYYHLAIRASSFASTKADPAFEVAEIGKDSPSKASLSCDSPSKEAKQLGVVEKEVDTTK